LDGTVALITGAASGIGRSCALRFSEQGALVMVADMNGERAEKVVSEILDAGGTADSWVVETSSETSCDDMVGAMVKRLPDRVDVCVGGAGISHAA
jgi:3-oxoacyl-[acyl-carrier protein] reductase